MAHSPQLYNAVSYGLWCIPRLPSNRIGVPQRCHDWQEARPGLDQKDHKHNHVIGISLPYWASLYAGFMGYPFFAALIGRFGILTANTKPLDPEAPQTMPLSSGAQSFIPDFGLCYALSLTLTGMECV